MKKNQAGHIIRFSPFEMGLIMQIGDKLGIGPSKVVRWSIREIAQAMGIFPEWHSQIRTRLSTVTGQQVKDFKDLEDPY